MKLPWLQKSFDSASLLLMKPWYIPVCFALGVGLPLIFHLLFPIEPMSDSAWYVARAAEIADGIGYQERGEPTAFWPVGWPALIAAASMLTGSTTSAVILLNLSAVICTLYSILWLGRRLTNDERVSRLALGLYSIYPAGLLYATQASNEVTYTGIALCAFCLLIATTRQLRWLILSGLLFGIATLIKPQTILFPAGVLIGLTIVYRTYTLRTAMLNALVIYACIFAVILPWSLRNQQVFDEFVLVSTNGGMALLIGANDQITGDHFEYQDTPVFKQLEIPWAERVKRQVELDKAQKAAAWDWIKENPIEYFSWMPSKVFLLWHKDTSAFWELDGTYPNAKIAVRFGQAINQLYYSVILILSFYCAVISLNAVLRRNSTLMPLALLFCMPVFVSLLAAVFTGQIRYHFPAMASLMIAAAWSLVILKRRME